MPRFSPHYIIICIIINYRSDSSVCTAEFPRFHPEIILRRVKVGQCNYRGGGGGLGSMDFFHTRMLLHGGMEG